MNQEPIPEPEHAVPTPAAKRSNHANRSSLYIVVTSLLLLGIYALFICIVLLKVNDSAERAQIGQFFGGIAAALSLIGVVVGLVLQARALAESEQARQKETKLAIKLEQFHAVILYYQMANAPEAREARGVVNAKGADAIIDTREANAVASHFELVGLLVKINLLPLWVFNSVAGQNAVGLYRKLQKHINAQQPKKSGFARPGYAGNFKWLVKQIERRFPEVLEEEKGP